MGRWGQVIRAFLSRHLLVAEGQQVVPEAELCRFEELLCERQLDKGVCFDGRSTAPQALVKAR